MPCITISITKYDDYICYFAGDDILLSNCIEDNISFVKQHKKVKILFSQLFKFSGKFDIKKKFKAYPQNFPTNLMDPKFTVEDQYKRLLISDRITYTPSCFLNKYTIVSVGGYDEKIISLFKQGVSLETISKELHLSKPEVEFVLKINQIK